MALTRRALCAEFRKAPAEALFLACCTFRAFDARDAIRATLGVPVVTSNQAALGAAVRVLRPAGSAAS